MREEHDQLAKSNKCKLKIERTIFFNSKNRNSSKKFTGDFKIRQIALVRSLRQDQELSFKLNIS